MNPEERHPSRDELLAMAYVDDELEPEARREVDARMASDAALRREVAELQALTVIARRVAPPEPMDHEWAELERDPLQRGAGSLAWTLIVVGGLGLAGYGGYELLTSELALLPKLCSTALLAGGVLLLFVTLRARLRTLPYDPYTKVKR